MKIAIGNDHAGVLFKNIICKHLESLHIEYKNFGVDNEESVDYADYIHPVAKMVQNDTECLGIILCGSGNGAQMTANKHAGIRAALCWNKEVVALAREHNNANILTLPARFITEEEVINFVTVFLNTKFEGGRHQRRIDKINID